MVSSRRKKEGVYAPGMSKRVEQEYRQYKPKQKKETMEEICYPREFRLQLPQAFLEDFMAPQTEHTGILVYHRPGAGKTCAAIRVAEEYIGLRQPVVMVPAFLRDNFRNELRTDCVGERYLRQVEKDELAKLDPFDPARKAIIDRSNERIDANYQILSHHKAAGMLVEGTLDLSGSLLIIDEVHNMISETGIHYETLGNAIRKADPPPRLMLLTATPIFDRPSEFALTMNLLLPPTRQMVTGAEFNEKYIKSRIVKGVLQYEMKNVEQFRNHIRGYVSYSRGGSSVAYASSAVEYVRVRLSDYALEIYNKVVRGEESQQLPLEVTNTFLCGTRAASNIVYPKGRMGETGLAGMKISDWSLAKIDRYAPKFSAILDRLRDSKGPELVYSNFKGYAGIEPLRRFLEVQGYRDLLLEGPGEKRYALWTGDSESKTKAHILDVVNDPKNRDGSLCALLLGSPSIREGVSLKRFRGVHLLEPHWNWSRMDQVIGRVLRLCGHRDLPASRRKVRICIYLATHPSLSPYSVDERLLQMAISKQKISDQFYRVIKEAAVDCRLMANANTEAGEGKIQCADS